LDICGKALTFAECSLNDCPFRYQGQYEDAETGLYYNRFRYYDPTIGSYLSQDPIGLAGGDKLYGYVHNPNEYIDVLGLMEIDGGWSARKAERGSILNANRPSSGTVHSTKHIQASSMEDAMNRSIKGVGGKPEASYFPEITKNNFNNFEKSSAIKAMKNGNVIQNGGARFYIYEHSTNVGFNMGEKTKFMRIEVTSGTIHSYPISEVDAKSYMKKCH
jgi:RHS repeat-associated protein